MKKNSLYIIITLVTLVSTAIWYRAAQKTIISPELATVIIGTNAEFPPFSFKDDKDTILGFDIDVITEVFKRLDKKTVLKDLPFDALIPEIQMGNIHVIAAGITPTPERAQQALFTKPHLTGNPLVIISPIAGQDESGKGVTSLEDLSGKTVIVNEGYLADSFMSEQPEIELIRLSSALVSDGMLALTNKRGDAFVTAQYSMKPYFEKYNRNDFNITTIPNTQETSAFAISKHYPDLGHSIQKTLDAMENDGTLNTLRKKWGVV